MSAGESIFVFVLQTLKEELRKHNDLKDGERLQLELLEGELGQLQAFLKDLASKSGKSELYIEMERQIREVAYDADDTIEIWLTQKAAAKSKNIFKKLLKKLSTDEAKHVISLREEKVRPILDKINRDFGNMDRPSISWEVARPIMNIINLEFPNMDRPGTSSEVNLDQSSETATEDQSNRIEKLVDFEDEATIIGYLMEPMAKLDVISITGLPGHGKTTLMRKIYNGEQIGDKFTFCFWIRVTQNFNSRNTFLSILDRFTSKGTSRASDEDLIITVQQCLKNEEFLLVVDELWNVNDWNEIQKILPEEKGKVVVISRQREVAQQANIHRIPHIMGFLNPEKSWELLQLKVFGDLESCPRELEGVGKAIAQKCNGLPLTIVVIGGTLKNKFNKTRAIPGLQQIWSEVLDDLNGILEDDKNKNISSVLELSYNYLPNDRRACFLYTGLFPENHDIPASTLTQLWISEGFIPPSRKSFEESAGEILDDLINGNLLMVTKKNLDQVKTCRVHDVIREFCKAKATKENLFRVMKRSDGLIQPPVSEVPNFRRLSLHSDPSNFLSEEPKGPRLRSFLCFLDSPFDLDPSQISTILDAFDVLRVLNCKSINFRQFPKVKRLILLKHITLSIDNLDVLPKQICKLLNLRTLIVDTNSRSITVKANIWKMIQLRCFKTKAAIFLDDKNWTGKACENLHTVCNLSPESCKATLANRAPNLKTLGIRGEVANLFDTFSLDSFTHLTKLKVVNDHLPLPSPLVLTQLDCFPPHLKRLTLSSTELKWNDHMPILANIRSLTVLKLKDHAFTGENWDSVGSGFENLQSLLIEETNLVVWNASITHFPSLRWLVIKTCKDLQEIPEILTRNLEKLEIENVQECVADSARRIDQLIKDQAVHELQSISGVPFKLTIGTICV